MSFSSEYERRAERLVSASAVGRAEGVANYRSMIHKANSVVFSTGTRPWSTWSGTANLNDVLLNLVYQKTQNNQPGELAQPSATYWPTSAMFRWPERFEGVAMAVLLQLWSRRRAANTTFCRCFLSRLNCLQRCYYGLASRLWYYYWPIRFGFHFLHTQSS